MNPWSNIEISSDDPEIKKIDDLEKALGTLPSHVRHIRELITGFEVCHFKFQQHIRYLKESILNLKANTVLKQIGANHIRYGENAWKKDKTGRSLTGQSYVGALNKWLGDKPELKGVTRNRNLEQNIKKWLGKKEPDKERLVRLLVARLKWNWKTYEELVAGKGNKELEFQVCRMDICHYNFPRNLDHVIQGIGDLSPIEAFEGCGSYSPDIKIFIEEEFLALIDLLKLISSKKHPGKSEWIKVWLISSMAKTMKEQVGLTQPIEGLVHKIK
ncbi:hypothetical protein ACFLU5_02505 [Bacteroidota bacterium]